MALTPTGVRGALLSNLASTGHLGAAVPKMAQGLANGLVAWVALVKVQTVDTGTAGVGAGVTPLVVAMPVVQAVVQAGFLAHEIIGPFAPSTVLGLSIGLTQAFLQGQIMTTHPSVGVGAGICTFRAPPASPFIQTALSAAGVSGLGTDKLALAVGTALDALFSALVSPVAIAGPPSPSPSAGVGFGQIV
jgi:hypothetical protein